jgi:GH43 family beta-xylosidase
VDLRPRLALLVLVLATPLRAQAPTPGTLVRDAYNVLLPAGADPWVVRHGADFLLCSSRGKAIALTRSPYLSTLGAGETRVIHRAPPGGPRGENLWAPELHRLRGKWYVYYAADDGRNENHRIYVLECADDDPFAGRWVERGRLVDPFDDHWAIDLTAFEHRGRLYAVWSGWEGTVDVRQDLYLAPMADPLTIAGPRVRIATPDRDWETVGDPDVNEGPTVLVRGGTIGVIYAASGSWTDSYCLGLITARADADLADPASWTKHPAPRFGGGNGVISPGHASVVATGDPAGEASDWLVYHAARHPGAGWDRLVRAQPLGWNPDGTPAAAPLADPARPLPLPPGEPPRWRVEAERAEGLGEVRVVRDPLDSGASHVAGLDAPGDALRLVVDVPRAGPHALAIRHATAGRRGARLTVTRQPEPIPAPLATARLLAVPATHAGPGRWSVATVRLDLPAGPSTLAVRVQGDPTAIDCLDLVPLARTATPSP